MSASENLSSMQMSKWHRKNKISFLSQNDKGGVSASLYPPSTHFYPHHASDEHGVPTLFDHSHLPPSIDNLFAHGHSGADVATHLGTMALESLHRYGELPSTDVRTSLSKDSVKLVNKVNEKMGKKPESIDPYNPATKEDAQHEVEGSKRVHVHLDEEKDPRHSKIDASTVGSGRALMRNMLAPKKNLNTKQFEHPELSL